MFKRKKLANQSMRELVRVVDEDELRQVVTGAGSDDLYMGAIPTAAAAFFPDQVMSADNRTSLNPLIVPRYR